MNQFRLLTAALIAFVLLMVAPSITHACSVCGGDPDSAMTAGMNAGIISLLIVTGLVLSMFVGFFVFLWRRQRQVARAPHIDQRWLDGMRRSTHA